MFRDRNYYKSGEFSPLDKDCLLLKIKWRLDLNINSPENHLLRI